VKPLSLPPPELAGAGNRSGLISSADHAAISPPKARADAQRARGESSRHEAACFVSSINDQTVQSMILYKYSSSHHAMQAIQEKRLKVSRVNELNDVHDCRPHIVYRRKSSSEFNAGFGQGMTSAVTRTMGIVCYCGNAVSPLVWAHYGDSSRGVALGFELNEGLFDRPEVPGDSRMVVRVVYRSEFEMLYWEDEIDPIPEESRKFELLIRGYNTKSAQWEHEHEYRELVDLLGCTLSAGLYFSNFRPGSLREVILGERCSLEPRFVPTLINESQEKGAAFEARLLRARACRNPSEVATMGQWIEAARGVSATNAATFAQYAASLRLIAGQILSVRKTKKRFGPGKGGAQAYRAAIDGASLEILSAQAVQRWRLAYVAQARNPAQERSRMTSANSTIRQARAARCRLISALFPSCVDSGRRQAGRSSSMPKVVNMARVFGAGTTGRMRFSRA
jgi:DUF2971 family protein